MELTTFRLREGVDENAFLAADAAVQAFHHRQPGLLRRTTARDTSSGDWLVVILWASWPHADAAVQAGRADEAVQSFAAMIDRASIAVRRFETLD
ncbi:MAG TPA: hypothetical protein VM933_02700 [Acidimicrobiales bacterium]|nr:hypothetical protein [Acidimicrobiales bacterium]